MTDRDSPVTPDELHAYVDGMLPPDRRAAVEAWLAAHREDAARVAEWRAQADAIRGHYGAVAQAPVPERLHLDRLAQSDRSWRPIAVAALIAALLGGIAGWMARGASAAAPTIFDTYTSEAIEAHKLYVVEVRHPVEVYGEEEEHLLQWLSKRLNYELRLPNLQGVGLKLVGGRLLPGPSGASAFFMYEGDGGDRITIYCAQSDAALAAMRYRAADPLAAVYWVDRNLAYVVSGPSDRERLQKVAQAVYDQLDKGPPR
jgi:anti-sigma factor RsiW